MISSNRLTAFDDIVNREKVVKVEQHVFSGRRQVIDEDPRLFHDQNLGKICSYIQGSYLLTRMEINVLVSSFQGISR